MASRVTSRLRTQQVRKAFLPRRAFTSPQPRPKPSSVLLTRTDLLWVVPVGFALGGGWWLYVSHTGDARRAELEDRYGPMLTRDEKAALYGVPQVKRPQEGRLSKGKGRLVELPSVGADEVVEPQTSIPFPSALSPTSLESSIREPLRLIGLGVRTVSFLSIRVYAAGFYADPAALRTIKSIAGWEGDLTKEKLLQSTAAAPITEGASPATPGGEALFHALLDSPANFTIRITPSRSTDFQHLRDGFYRSLVARMKLATASGQLSDRDSERVVASLQTLKSFFPTGTAVPKGRSLLLTKTSSSSLVVEYDGNTLGELRDPFVARELLLAYFADKAPISDKLKASVAEGFEMLLRPREAAAGV